MLNELLKSFNSLQAAGAVAFFVSIIVALFKFIKPLWEKKITTEKNTHVKQELELGLKFANAIVPEMAVLEALSKSDRKKEAMRFVNEQLQKNGFALDYQTISALIEQSYQAYKGTKGDNHAPKVTPLPAEPAGDPNEIAPEKSDK